MTFENACSIGLTLGEGGRGAFFEVRFQQPPGTLTDLWLGAGTLLRGEGASLLSQLGVALDTEERLTPNERAASLLVVPRRRASTIFLRRSSE